MPRLVPLPLFVVLAVSVVFIIPNEVLAQGPSSRGSFAGPSYERTYETRNAYGDTVDVTETVESPGPAIPDLFRMEAPFVERNFRLDYDFTNNLHEPLADESQIFGEINYSFNEQFGVNLASPFLMRDHDDGTESAGFGDLEAGVRYVAIGYEEEAQFKLAFGLAVEAPTGDVGEELGEGLTFLEPQVLALRKLPDYTFVQTQVALGIPTESGETTEFVYNVGMGRIYPTRPDSFGFYNPTATLELNGVTGVGGAEAGASILDITPGLRWSVGKKTFAGVALSVPLTEEREFDTQFIFSVIHQYGGGHGSSVSTGQPTSRAAF